MKKATVTYTGITKGRAREKLAARDGQFESSSGIDPDFSMSFETTPYGAAMPCASTKFSGDEVNAATISIITCPKSNLVYVVLSNGKLVRYTSGLAFESLLGTAAGNNASGACYYNNYIYIFGTGAAKDDVSRYGPIDQPGASMTDSFWKTTLGLAALTNTLYPYVRSGYLPNHWGFVHGDNSLYFADFKDGQGLIHRIHTKKVTYEGDTDDTSVPSAYNVLDLPFGYYPTAIASYSTYVAILAVQTTSYEMYQGPAALFIWNPTDETSFDQKIDLPDPLASALTVRNGLLHVFSGTAQRGIRISTYAGGDTVSEVAYIADGTPPRPGAVEVDGRRLLFGSYCTEPNESAAVWALGSLSSGSDFDVQNIISVGTILSAKTQNVTAIKVVSRMTGSESNPQIAVASFNDVTNYELYKRGGTGIQGNISLPTTVVGRKFKIDEIHIPLGSAVDSGTIIEPTINYDFGSSVKVLNTISNVNYPGAYKVEYVDGQLPTCGLNAFRLSFRWSGTINTPIAFPITVKLTVYDD